MVAVLHSTDWKDRIFTIQRCKNSQKDQLGVNLKGPSLQWKEIACFPYHQQGPRNSGINCQRRRHSQQGFWTKQMQNQRHPQAQNWQHRPGEICLCFDLLFFNYFPHFRLYSIIGHQRFHDLQPWNPHSLNDLSCSPATENSISQ